MRIRFALPLMAAAACLRGTHAQASQPQGLPEVLIPIRMPGDPPIVLPALAEGSGLPLTWEAATGPVTVAGKVATLTGGLGPVTLKASQPGDGIWDSLVGHVCFSVSGEGGFKQVCRRLTHSDNGSTYGLTRSGRIVGYDLQYVAKHGWISIASGLGEKWRWVSPGAGYKPHAIAEDGSLWHWPNGFVPPTTEQLGDAIDPVKIGNATDWSQVVVSDTLRAAIKADGSLWRWIDTETQSVAVPLKVEGFSDWEEISMALADFSAGRRANGAAHDLYFNLKATPSEGTLWKTVSISWAGITGVNMDGTLWHKLGENQKRLSADTDWSASASLRRTYAALRQDGTVWRGELPQPSEAVKAPRLYPTKTRWTMLSPGLQGFSLLSRDGALWRRPFNDASNINATGPNIDGGFTRIAPAFYPQTLDFMAAREQPFPVVPGSTLEVQESALNSKLPLALSLVSGPAVIAGQGISFTGPGLVEVIFKQEGNAVWGAFEERRTFLSQAAGPEIAVHDGTSSNNPPRGDNGSALYLGRKTKAGMAAGVARSFVLENTGTAPLSIPAVSAQAAGPLSFTTSFTPARVDPGGTLPLDITLHASEYGTPTLTVLLHSDDGDEPAYRIPFRIELANTPPYASIGPDRQVHAGSMMRLDGSFFSRDLEQAATDLTYTWDLDGNGYSISGAVQELTLATLGQRIIAKLRVTDGDGASAYSECLITAVTPGMDIPTSIRPAEDSAYEFVFHGLPGKLYRLEYSPDLIQWRREDDSTSRKLPPFICGQDGFFTAKSWSKYGNRTFYRAQEVTE